VILVVKIVIAIAVFVAVMRIGMWILGGMARANPSPEDGILRSVNLRYRCPVCLAEVKMVVASEELPAPPRHCQEDMDLVPPLFE
jgi:hypothetical protein